jgi:hypothetical protein
LTSDIVPPSPGKTGPMGVALRSFLTSSHSNQPAKAGRIPWCLQETAYSQRRDDHKGHRQDAAACVSLSKSTMSKTQTGKPAPPESEKLWEPRTAERICMEEAPSRFSPQPPGPRPKARHRAIVWTVPATPSLQKHRLRSGGRRYL